MSTLTKEQMQRIGEQMLDIVKDTATNGEGGLVFILTAMESFCYTLQEISMETLQEKMSQYPPDDLENWKYRIVPPLLERILAFKAETAAELQMNEVMEMFERFKRDSDAPLH